MNVWLIKTGEPVPFVSAEAKDRLYRAGALAKALVDEGHEATWWTGHFSHQTKVHRDVQADCVINGVAADGSAGPDLIFLSSPGYQKHIGFQRLWDHWKTARRFADLAPTLPRPDVIICAYPTIDLASVAVDFGRANDCPVILDVRDFWPDVVYERLNDKLPFSVDGMMVPYERMARKVFAGAHAATGVSQAALDWGRGRFGGDAGRDKPFYQSKSPPKSTKPTDQDRDFWTSKGVDLNVKKTRFVWAGNLVHETDGETLLSAINSMPAAHHDAVEFVFCGNGTLVPQIEEMAARMSCVRYGGWVDAFKLSALMQASHIGLLCYLNRFDFQSAVPNKVVDYCAGGLRTLTNLKGELARLMRGADSLISYPTGDVSALRDLLVAIASDPARYRVKHRPTLDVFEQYFNADNVMPDFISYIQGIAQS